MSGSISVVGVLGACLSLFIIWLLFFWLYRDYRVDLVRQRLFALRDDLFELAREGVLTFDHPAYGLLRTTLNGFIRFGHRLRFWSMMWTAWRMGDLLEDPEVSFQQRWDRALAQVDDPATREQLNDVVMRMHVLVVEQLLVTSAGLMVSLVPMTLWLVGRHLGRHLSKQIRRWWEQYILNAVDTAALAIGGNSGWGNPVGPPVEAAAFANTLH